MVERLARGGPAGGFRHRGHEVSDDESRRIIEVVERETISRPRQQGDASIFPNCKQMNRNERARWQQGRPRIIKM